MSKRKSEKKRVTRLTTKQRQFVEYLSNPDDSESPEEFARRINIKLETLHTWKANPVIIQSAFQICVTRLGAEIPKVLKMLLQKALVDKDISACKLFFQQLDHITEIPETGLSVDEALKLINKAVHQIETDESKVKMHGCPNDPE